MKNYTVTDFDYHLPEALIAQFPTINRSDSRLLVAPDNALTFQHESFPAFLNYVNPNDLIVFNDTRVINARLHGKKETGGTVSCLIERILSDNTALAHVRASHTLSVGSRIVFEEVMEATVIAREGSLFILQFTIDKPLSDMLMQYGHLPLPPYISRAVKGSDLERYQTIYAKTQGAVAAPTAGLHFDDALLMALKNKQVRMAYLTLHVGAGTFQPVRVDTISDHVMHQERVIVTPELCEKIQACRARGGRVIAVGTTVVRALESAASSGTLQPLMGDTQIFITPGFQFQVVDMLLTNFHLPKSTLLMLVSAFAGFDRMKAAYQIAVAEQYRFFSYGDAMLLYRNKAAQ